MLKRYLLISLGIGLMAGLGACGQKGDLYLPNHSSEVPAPVVQSPKGLQ